MTASPGGDTIFALSSGSVPAAIAIVRVSGPSAGAALQALAGVMPAPRLATYRALRDGTGALLDRALLLWFPGPRSATGEDLAEFHLHGGRAVVTAVLEMLATIEGLRPANAGEFTRRALMNGRIDLTAAEGLAELLAAETRDDHARAIRMAEGGLGRIVERWRETILTLSARVEAWIEFGETEDDVGAASLDLTAELRALFEEANALLARPPAERLRDGFRVVVGGPPNSGKSSLINVLAEREVALATPVPGTTRDIVEAPVRLGAHAIILTDTAGIRDATDEVEKLGIDRAKTALDRADLILWCGDIATCPDPTRSIILFTRSDLRSETPPVGTIPVSIHDHRSIQHVREMIEERSQSFAGPADALSMTIRQHELVRSIAARLAQAVSEQDAVLVAEHLRGSRADLDAVSGRAGTEEMLDALFSRFCVGK